jgi:hypothetical protein
MASERYTVNWQAGEQSSVVQCVMLMRDSSLFASRLASCLSRRVCSRVGSYAITGYLSCFKSPRRVSVAQATFFDFACPLCSSTRCPSTMPS